MKEVTVFLVNETNLKDWMDVLPVNSYKKYKDPPVTCEVCGDKDFVGVLVIGAHNRSLFWECESCGNLHLKYGKGYTKKLLGKLEGLSINLDDFYDTPDTEELN
mgnify:CR=1 FL=1|tara:strand:+ start:54 stop:365 length:312 start_codon:yes stop_codon:yes gene_type:complete